MAHRAVAARDANSERSVAVDFAHRFATSAAPGDTARFVRFFAITVIVARLRTHVNKIFSQRLLTFVGAWRIVFLG